MDEITDHLKEELASLDFGYRPGAWEDFKKREKKRRRLILWRRVSVAAAILLVGIGTYLQINNSQQTVEKLSYKTEERQNKLAIAEAEETTPRVLASITPSNSSKHLSSLFGNRQLLPRAGSAGIALPQVRQTSFVIARPFTTSNAPADATNIEKAPFSRPVEEPGSPTGKSSKPRAWTFGLAVGQGIDSRSKMDLNIGTQLSYKVSKKLSLSTGLYYSELGGAKKITPDYAALRSGRMLSSTTATMRGIDIPLELQYHLTSKVYARLGVSAFAVTSQEQSLEYTSQSTGVSTFVDASGNTQTQAVTTSSVSSESVAKNQLEDYRNFGLYNMAIGFDQKLTSKNTISIEPFVKIPFSKFSEHQVNLAQGGLRLKVSF
ncbi:outer membrane beta-barrel protein [Pedobacter sp. HMF7647]|uniref:Outer membrane beta-barrel protein n=1 Tax=Hufsiella arboris TaxID=2695275 RepID=A0A7K1Y866_9SPHI|nr:outer membrane beta-barrel protein [Hufsiella arboris]MXV50289.1 outer membrane beta-barrel protein [Hufsiella arboris]